MRQPGFIIILMGLMRMQDAIGQDLHLTDHAITRTTNFYASRSMAKGPDGALYVAGVFNGVLIQGDDTLSTASTDAVYLARFNENLSLDWIKKVADNNLSIAAYQARVAIGSDPVGNAILGISYTGRLYFNGDTIGGDSAVGTVLLWFDPNGQFTRAEPIEGEMIGDRGVMCDSNGDVYLTGVSERDVFVEKRSDSGVQIWRRVAGGPNNYDKGNVIALDHLGNAYVVGQLTPSNAVYFDAVHVTFPIQAQHASFVAKYDPDGTIQWVRYIYTTSFGNFSVFRAITFDPNGNPILAGSYADSQLRFSNGSSSVGDQLAGYPNAFLTAYDSAGDRLWVRTSPDQDTGSDSATDLDTLGSSLLVLNGFTGTVASGTGSLSSHGYEDMRVQHFDFGGNWISDFHIGGTSTEFGIDLLVHNAAVFVLGGSGSHPLHVGEVLVEHPDPTSIFLLKLLAGPTGVRDLIEGEAFRVFPNPNQGAFFVEEMPPATAYTITDPTGRVVHTGLSERNGTTAVHLPDTSHGVYLSKRPVNYLSARAPNLLRAASCMAAAR